MRQYSTKNLLLTLWSDEAVTIYGRVFSRRVDVSFGIPQWLRRLLG